MVAIQWEHWQNLNFATEVLPLLSSCRARLGKLAARPSSPFCVSKLYSLLETTVIMVVMMNLGEFSDARCFDDLALFTSWQNSIFGIPPASSQHNSSPFLSPVATLYYDRFRHNAIIFHRIDPDLLD